MSSSKGHWYSTSPSLTLSPDLWMFPLVDFHCPFGIELRRPSCSGPLQPIQPHSLLFFILSLLVPLTFRFSHGCYASFCPGAFPSDGKLFPSLFTYLIYIHSSDLSSTKHPQESFCWPLNVESFAKSTCMATFPFFPRLFLNCSLYHVYSSVWLVICLSHQTVSFLRVCTVTVLLTIESLTPHRMSGTL